MIATAAMPGQESPHRIEGAVRFLPGSARLGEGRLTTYCIYGVTLETEFSFQWPVPRGGDGPELRFSCTDTAPIHLDWSSLEPAYSEPLTEREDGPAVTYYVLDGLDVIRIGTDADHYLWDDRIICHLHDPAHSYLVEIQLLGMVLALWLERRGIPTLHASVAVVEGGAVAFLGTKGGGKTTAATSLMAAGHPMLVDDLLALRTQDGQVTAQSGYPMLRLWPEQVEHFVGYPDVLPLVHPAFTKRRVPVGSGFGSFHPAPAPLRRIYVPQRQEGVEVVIEPMRSSAALIAMVQHSFLKNEMVPLGLAPGRLEQLADVLGRVPVRTVRYPNGFERLPELVAAIEANLLESPA
jgi:hypothetical protein